MKKLLLSILIVSGCLARADTNIVVNFLFTDDQWATLQEKLALVNADLATSYTNALGKWQEDCIKAASLGKTNPPAPVLVVLDAGAYMYRFGTNALLGTKLELRGARRQKVSDALPPELTAAQVKAILKFIHTNIVPGP